MAFVGTVTSGVWAHELRPAYLEVRQTGLDTYEVLWKVPARGEELRLALYVRLPPNCQHTMPQKAVVGGAYAERWRVQCTGGLTDDAIRIDGLSTTLTDVLVRVERLDGTAQVTRLTPSEPAFVVEASPDRLQAVVTYLKLGVEHITLGIDHLLFVLGLLLIVQGRSRLLKTITAFTLAHSVTLVVATLGYARVPLPPVEMAIALSILFLGPEVIRSWRGESSLTIRYPWMVAFGFGLLHGFGFASGLSIAGLPQAHLPLALFSFNVGVELGQLVFVAVALLLTGSFHALKIRWPVWVLRTPGYVVGTCGAYWTIQRGLMLFGG
jgi:hydrogenase/urease accessory protein HupE